MGCDIHFYVEKLNNGKWEAVKGKNPDIDRYRGYAQQCIERGEKENALHYEKLATEIENGTKLKSAEDDYDREHYAPEVLADWAYKGRNYDLFAILADVRNGRGFAGSYTGEGFIPISEPKGAPEDMSDELKAAYVYWDADGHSHSWFTVKELVEYNWDQTTFSLKPGLYPMGMSIGELQRNTEQYSYKDSVGSFYTSTIPMLKELAGDDLNSVRIVFWFDN